MIYTVTFNPSLDYVVQADQLIPGEINRTTSEHIYPGGKGNNVSVILSNLGLKSKALGFKAGFTGDVLEKMLEEFGCETDFIPLKEGNSRINVKINAGTETEINGQGPVITEEAIQALYEKLDKLEEGQKAESPGMKYKHYAPKGELTIISGQADHVRKRLQQEVDKKRAQGYKVGVIAAGEDGSAYQADSVKVTGNRDDLAQIAKDLFRMLREFDDEGMDFMYTEGFSDKGIGQAVMNRLLKAAGHKIIDADQEETDDSNRQ